MKIKGRLFQFIVANSDKVYKARERGIKKRVKISINSKEDSKKDNKGEVKKNTR